MRDAHAHAIAAVVQRHLPAVLADLRTMPTKPSPPEARGPCIFCGRVEKHVPGCMFQDDEVDARCVAELMQRCLPDLLAEQLPAALEQTGEGKRRERSSAGEVGEVGEVSEHGEKKTNPDSKQKQERHDPRSRTIFHLVQLHMPAALAEALPAALKRTLPAVLPDILPSMLPDILPSILPEILSTILPALFALPPSFTSSYDSSSFDSSSPSPERPSIGPRHNRNDYTLRPSSLTPLGASLLPHLLTSLFPQLQKMHARALARGVHYWQRTAFAELEDTVLGYKGELSQLRDEGLEELRAEAREAVNLAIDGVREEAMGVAEMVEDEVCGRAEDVKDELCERIEREVKRRGEMAVADVRRAVQDAVRDAEHRGGKEESFRGKRWHKNRTRHGKGGYRGLGRRGEPAAKTAPDLPPSICGRESLQFAS